MITKDVAPPASRGLRVLIAPDKFKGSLTARQAAEAIAAGVLEAAPDSDLTLLPVADGGEGTIDALTAAGAVVHQLRVRGPLGDATHASWASLRDTAVVEMAQAAGLQLIQQPSTATAEAASTYGVGQLIRDALDHGFRTIIVAAGGVGSTDGGAGALSALGLTILDQAGVPITRSKDLEHAASLDLSGWDPRLADTEIFVATDVSVPLLGPRGAARLFAPQKGANPAAVERLECRLANWNAILVNAFAVDVANTAGVGAAGGFATGFLAAGVARIVPGAQLIGELIGLEAAIASSDLVVVGEGSLDDQSLEGKAPIAIARAARTLDIPVIALAGTIQSAARHELSAHGIWSAACIMDMAEDTEDAMTNAYPMLRVLAARTIARFGSAKPQSLALHSAYGSPA